MSKQDKVVEMVKAGQYTRDEIREGAECTSGALASYLSGMSNAAKYTGAAICPIVDPETKVYSVTTYEEAEAAKAERATATSRVSKKSPAERFEAADKRVTRTASLKDKAQERFEAAPDNRELELRRDKAVIEYELAEIELARASQLNEEAPEEAGDAPEDADEFPEEEDELI